MIVEAAAALALAPALRPAPAIRTQPGWRAEVYATGLRHPAAAAWGPDGLLYVTQDTGEVVAVGRGSTRPRVAARDLRVPLGLAWVGRTLYVSTQGAVVRMRLAGRRLVGRRVVLSGLPYGRHQQNNLVVGADGRLYLGSGSTCDVCRERDRRAATVLSFRPDGSRLRVEARGLRNPYGLVAARDGAVYVTVNGQDDLGAAEPAESVVRLRRGAHYGWPRCRPSWRLRRLVGSCRGVAAPLAYLEPHSAAAGIAELDGALYVAEWGQYLSDRWGRKLVRVDPRSGRVSLVARGFAHPLAVVADPRGGIVVSDWGRGVLYRVSEVAG